NRDLAALESGQRLPYRKSDWKIAVAILSVLVIGAAGLWFWSQQAASNSDVHLRTTIRTDPPGALVVLGDHAERSPATFDELEPRIYKLRVMSPGYEPVETTVNLSGKRSVDL